MPIKVTAIQTFLNVAKTVAVLAKKNLLMLTNIVAANISKCHVGEVETREYYKEHIFLLYLLVERYFASKGCYTVPG